MTLKIHNVDKWKPLTPGQGLQMPGDRHHSVRLHLNVEGRASVRLVSDAGTIHFLGVVEGMEVVEYGWTGPHVISVDGEGEVWWFTDHGGQIAVERPEAKSFVKMMTRRKRDPELERLMFKQEQRMQQMLAQQARQMQALRDAMSASSREQTEGETDGQEPANAAGGSKGKKQPGAASGGAGAGSGLEGDGQAEPAGTAGGGADASGV